MGVRDRFSRLKKKFPKGSVFGKKPEKPKKDLLEGMVATGPALDRMAKDAGRTEYGRTGEEKKSFFSKIKGKYSDWSKKRSEKARQKKYFTVKKCPKCGQKHTAAEPCPATGKPEPQLEARKIEGNFPVVIGSGGLLAVLAFWQFPIALIALVAVLLVLGIISFFLPPSFKNMANWIIILGFLSCAGLLLYMGQFEMITEHPKIAVYAEQIEETYDTIAENAKSMYEKSVCYTKFNPDKVNACLEKIEERGKSGSEDFSNLKEYITLEIKAGNPYRDFKQNKPRKSGDRDFDWEVTLINKNPKTFNISIIDIDAWHEDEDGNIITGTHEYEDGYNLLPDKNLYIRFHFPYTAIDFTDCTSKTFKLNVTTQQTGATDSWFGIAPNDTLEEWQEFIQGYDPKYQPDPGPLDVFAYTYPFGIDQDYYLDSGRQIKIIINLRNPKADGIIFVKEFYFIQNFKFPYKYFDIEEISCTKNFGLVTITPHTDVTECNIDYLNLNNCIRFEFTPELKIPKGEVEEIICEATVNNYPLTDEYEDLMRVYATYDFFQDWDQALICTGAALEIE